MGGGQQLASPGSCLESFRHHPYVECNSRGQCHFFSDKHSFWLVSILGARDFRTSVDSMTIKADEYKDKVGRCRVCMLEMRGGRDGGDGEGEGGGEGGIDTGSGEDPRGDNFRGNVYEAFSARGDIPSE